MADKIIESVVWEAAEILGCTAFLKENESALQVCINILQCTFLAKPPLCSVLKALGAVVECHNPSSETDAVPSCVRRKLTAPDDTKMIWHPVDQKQPNRSCESPSTPTPLPATAPAAAQASWSLHLQDVSNDPRINISTVTVQTNRSVLARSCPATVAPIWIPSPSTNSFRREGGGCLAWKPDTVVHVVIGDADVLCSPSVSLEPHANARAMFVFMNNTPGDVFYLLDACVPSTPAELGRLGPYERLNFEKPVGRMFVYKYDNMKVPERVIRPNIAGLPVVSSKNDILVCGHINETGMISKSVDIFTPCDDDNTMQGRRSPGMITARWGYGIARTSGHVYVVGGITERRMCSSVSDITNIVETFDLEKNEWKKMPSMSMNRYRPGVVVVDDRIFVIGGSDGHEYLNTCEMFDVRTNKWETIAPMPTMRNEMGVAVIGDRIIVIGGRNSGGYLRTVEALNTKTNTWTTLPPISAARSGVAVGVVDDQFIWTFGGISGSGALDVIEVFDAEKNEWTRSGCSRMMCSQYDAKAAVVGHNIYVTGGLDSFGAVFNSLKVFNVDVTTWGNVTVLE